MKPYNLLRENILFIVKQGQDRVNKKIEKDMMALHWKIGYELRDFGKKELKRVVRRLSTDLGISAQMFIASYEFYMRCPLYNKAVRCAR